MKDKLDLLIEVLNDLNARDDERDDAAIDIQLYPDEKGLIALYPIVTNSNEDDSFVESAAESIAQIWLQLNRLTDSDIDVYKKMLPHAQWEIDAVINNNKPEWLEKLKS